MGRVYRFFVLQWSTNPKYKKHYAYIIVQEYLAIGSALPKDE